MLKALWRVAKALTNLLGLSLEHRNTPHSSLGGALPQISVTASAMQFKLLNSKRCQGWDYKTDSCLGPQEAKSLRNQQFQHQKASVNSGDQKETLPCFFFVPRSGVIL